MDNTKYYEDLTVGDKWVTPRRTVSAAEMISFNNLLWINGPPFVDEEYIENQTPMKRRFATGVMTIPLAAGLFTQLRLLGDSLIAMVGMEVRDMKKPLFAGDTIYVEVEVVGKNETSKNDRGIVKFCYTTKNQHDEILARITETILIKRKQE